MSSSTAMQHIRLLAFDVDGVLTDGKLYVDEEGRELHAFNMHDGMGMVLARKRGLILVAISGRFSGGVRARLTQLGVDEVHLGVGDKLGLLKRILARRKISAAQCCYVGDDVNDVEIMAHVGQSFAPANAHQSALDAAKNIAQKAGGQGAMREIIDLWLNA